MFKVIFGDQPIRVTGTGSAPDEYILDLGYQVTGLTLVIRLYSSTATGGSPAVRVGIETALELHDDVWFPLGDFADVTVVGSKDKDKRDFASPLRFIRWYVSDMTDVSDAVFMIYGVAR